MLARTDRTCRYTGKIITDPLSTKPFCQLQAETRRERASIVERQYFVLCTEPNMERKAAAHLTGRGWKALAPEMLGRTTRGHRRRKVPTKRMIFPGYLFLLFSFEIDGDRRHQIDATFGIHRFLRLGNDYAIVSHEDMAKICDIEQELLKPKQVHGPSAIFDVGETIRVSEGPFCGLNAKIVRLDDDERITILLSLLGRAVPTKIEAEALEKL